jgi:hypothetical protein
MEENKESAEQPAEAPIRVPEVIVVDQKSQALVARDQSELVRMIRMFMKGQAFPKSLDSEAKIIAAWQLGASLNVPPIRAIQNIAFVNGVMSIWGELPKALAEATGELKQFEVLMIDEKQDVICLKNKNLNATPWAAVVHIQREGRNLNEYVFTLDDADKAGLLNKKGPWQEYRSIMLARRAIAKGIKFEFPDALMGVKIAEYDLDVAPDLKDVTPSAGERLSRAEELNKRFSQGGDDGTVQQ